jgi:branched-chain amino acid transport system substrate-binding protein
MSRTRKFQCIGRGSRLAVVVACAAFVLAGCGGDDDSPSAASDSGASSEGGTYKIGWAQAKTGYLALVDQPLEKGLKAEIARINDDGGIDGKWKIELDNRDMKTDPAVGATVAQELVSDGIDMLVTTCDTDVSLPGAQIAAQEQIPVISSCGAGADFPKQIADYGFLNVSGTAAEGSALAEYADEQGYKTAFVLSSPSEAYTSLLPKAFTNRFTELGGKIVGTATYKIGDSDYRATATKIVAAKPDAIVPATFPPDSISFLQNLQAAGNEQPILLNDGNDSPAIFGAGEQLKHATMLTYGGYDGDDSTAAAWLAKYRDMFGEDPGSLQTSLGADLVDVVAAAVTAAGTTDGAKVAAALRELPTTPGASGPTTYATADSGLPVGVPKKPFAVATFDRASKKIEVQKSFFPEKVTE